MELMLVKVLENGDNEMLFREEINHRFYEYYTVITHEALEEGFINEAMEYVDEKFERIRNKGD